MRARSAIATRVALARWVGLFQKAPEYDDNRVVVADFAVARDVHRYPAHTRLPRPLA